MISAAAPHPDRSNTTLSCAPHIVVPRGDEPRQRAPDTLVVFLSLQRQAAQKVVSPDGACRNALLSLCMLWRLVLHQVPGQVRRPEGHCRRAGASPPSFPILAHHDQDSAGFDSGSAMHAVMATDRVLFVLLSMQNRTFRPYLAARAGEWRPTTGAGMCSRGTPVTCHTVTTSALNGAMETQAAVRQVQSMRPWRELATAPNKQHTCVPCSFWDKLPHEAPGITGMRILSMVCK
jgi:hypothetical protein